MLRFSFFVLLIWDERTHTQVSRTCCGAGMEQRLWGEEWRSAPGSRGHSAPRIPEGMRLPGVQGARLPGVRVEFQPGSAGRQTERPLSKQGADSPFLSIQARRNGSGWSSLDPGFCILSCAPGKGEKSSVRRELGQEHEDVSVPPPLLPRPHSSSPSKNTDLGDSL